MAVSLSLEPTARGIDMNEFIPDSAEWKRKLGRIAAAFVDRENDPVLQVQWKVELMFQLESITN